MTKQKATATVEEFFSWYAGPSWKEDWQTTNTMTVNGIHAQKSGDQGVSVLEFLTEHQNDTINMEGEFVFCAYDIQFELAGKKIMVQAAGFYGDDF